MADYIELTTGSEPPARSSSQAIHAETEGNPLFVVEVVRLLDAEGGIAAGDADLRDPARASAP